MIPASFDYLVAKNLDEALRMLAGSSGEAKILAGGHSLLPLMKLRLANPKLLIDVSKISGLNEIRQQGDRLVVGALATHYQVESSALLKKVCPLLPDTARTIGDVQVRNRGTIGGSLTHADPAADWPAAMLALDAEVVARSSRGERVIKAADFFVDVMTSAVQPDEVVTEIRVPKPAQPKAAVYLKVPQSASGFAIVGVAAQLKLNNGQCEDIGIGVTGLAPKAFRATSVEAALRGKAIDDAAVNAAAEKADAEAADAMEDIHASGDYRRHLARVYARRAVQAAAARA